MKQLFFWTIISCILSCQAFCQQKMKGWVVDSETHLPIMNARVIIHGTDIESVTDSLGQFNIEADSSSIISIVANEYESASATHMNASKKIVIELIPEVFTIVQKQPEPVGGYPSLYNYIAKNLRYPADARRMGIQGKVFVRFVVDIDGSLTQIQVVNGIGGGCDEEAVRLFMASPKWQPGMREGKRVKVRMMLPITFRLG